MGLAESYPREWNDISKNRVFQKDIDEYVLNFVFRLIEDIKLGNKEEIDLGDSWGIGLRIEAKGYKLDPIVYGFLFRLSDYHMEDVLGSGDSEYGTMFKTLGEVELELYTVADKLRIVINKNST